MAFTDVIASLNYAQLHQRSHPALRELATGATRYVPGVGPIGTARLMFVGEAPGATEDRLGLPFVGKSGRFLDELLKSIGLQREDVWITNVVKFRPPGNRDPEQPEIDAALPYLRRELALVGAESGCRTIVGLGRIACGALAGAAITMGRSHGSLVPLRRDWKLFVSYHPSWGVRAPRNRDVMLADFQCLLYQHGRIWNR